MRRTIGLWLSVGMVMVLGAACSGNGATFNPVGAYTGTVYPGGTPESISAGVTSTSTAGTWDFSAYVPSTSVTLTGTCTHNTGLSAIDLSCDYTYSTGSGTFVGDLSGNTWSGTLTEGPDTATFVLTR